MNDALSRAAFRGEPEGSAYRARRASLNALGQSLVIVPASYRIVLPAVAPRFTATATARERFDAPSGDAIRAQSPFGRVADPAWEEKTG